MSVRTAGWFTARVASGPRGRLTGGVPSDGRLDRVREDAPELPRLLVGGEWLPLQLVRNPRARRYILRLQVNGGARVTIPRGGTFIEARRFAERHLEWLARQRQQRAAQAAVPRGWHVGSSILFRGEPVVLALALDAPANRLVFADQAVSVPDLGGDVRPAVERHLWDLARRELPPRVWVLATEHGLSVRRVVVRNQRSRWGSCSPRGTISLNWRLVQAPLWVRDYLVLHELMHLRHMNHSRRFWREVERVCPEFREAERWLKQHGDELR